MFGSSKPHPIAEEEATGDIDRVYHEIKQSLRVSGVNLNFRTWAGYDSFLPMMWDAFRPNLETRNFEEGADRLRAETAQAAQTFEAPSAVSQSSLGRSQVYQIQAALDLYHYINPKLLLLTSAVRLALDGQEIGTNDDPPKDVESIERGVPPRMAALEMEAEEPDDPQLQEAFADIRRTLDLPSINSDYRTMALWPDYLVAAWDYLKPLTGRDGYGVATQRIRDEARNLARNLPYPFSIPPTWLEEYGVDVEAVRGVTETFERLLPGLILNVALFVSEWKTGTDLAASPFPAVSRDIRTGGAA